MRKVPEREIKLFYCYAREDRSLRDELEKHLSGLKCRYQFTNWHDREILPGEEWKPVIDKNLNAAHFILLLISSDFIASNYCYDKEMQRALERHKEGSCRVVPILLRPIDWKDAPFSHLQLLPTDAKPITDWTDWDKAFQDVVSGISRTIENLLKTKENRLKGGKSHGTKRYEEALIAYEQAIHLDPNKADNYRHKADILRTLKRYEEALIDYDQVIRLSPNEADSYHRKADTLHYCFKRYDEALIAYEQAIHLDPNKADNYRRKADILYEYLNRYEEALIAYEQVIRLDPNDANSCYRKADILRRLKRYEEALIAFEEAIHLNSTQAAYDHKAAILSTLKRYEEAEQTSEEARQLVIKAKRPA